MHLNNVYQSTTLNINHHYLLDCITWIYLVDILIKFTTTYGKAYSMNSLQNITHIRLIHKMHSHFSLQFTIAHYSPYIQYIFYALNYNCTYGWRRNLVGHNMKFLTTSPIFRIGGSSISTLLKRIYSSSSFLYTTIETHSS